MRPGLSRSNLLALACGLAFLYLPLLVLVLHSFNAGRMVAVWGGFSLRWYGEVFANPALLAAAQVSVTVAMLSASVALVLGTLAATALQRLAGAFGRTLFAGLLFTPLVLPEVIIGLALLLLFVALGIDRGATTIVIAHATVTTGYVAVVVQSRLLALDPAQEEAAIDLGAPPLGAFLLVTLPQIAPALAAAWLLAFTLSLDDLVIAAFTSGPGATTLPMRLYGQARLGVTPDVNALSTLMIAAVVGALVVASAVEKRWRSRAGLRR
ncbi:MAG: ABC transporter permease [Alphaproteobacteria bacterium]|nr:ABC transporter permease [Alphaproteobacteria bacterium]